MSKRLFLIIIPLAISFSIFLSSPGIQASTNALRKIAFECWSDKNWDIYTVNEDGSELTRLTVEKAEDRHPSWSPDGSRLLFTSNRDGDFEIYLMNIDGTNLIKLTDNEVDDLEPVWSPDGTKIAFTSRRDGR